METVVEYKNTTKSKFTFTIAEVRIKVAEKDRCIENVLTSRALEVYNMLLSAGWTGITLRSNAVDKDNLRLHDSYKNKVAVIIGTTVQWYSDKGTKTWNEN